jgi:hypothetical protein
MAPATPQPLSARRSSSVPTPPEAITGTGVAGVIVGKAIYEKRFTVEEALAACAA